MYVIFKMLVRSGRPVPCGCDSIAFLLNGYLFDLIVMYSPFLKNQKSTYIFHKTCTDRAIWRLLLRSEFRPVSEGETAGSTDLHVALRKKAESACCLILHISGEATVVEPRESINFQIPKYPSFEEAKQLLVWFNVP